MYLIIDAVGASKGGSITILNNILYYFTMHDPNLKIRVYIEKTPVSRYNIFLNDEIELVTLDNMSLVQKIIWQQKKLPILAQKTGGDVILSITNVGSFFPKVPQVIYFHQALLFIPNRDLFNFFDFVYIIRFKVLKLFVVLGFLKAKAIVAQTKTVKKNICKQFPSFESKVFTVYSGIPKIFENTISSWSAPSEIQKEFKILYIAHPAEYKNFDILFEAAKVAKSMDIKFKFLLTIDKFSQNKRYQRFISNYLDQIRESNIEEYFYFIGTLKNPSEIEQAYLFTDVVIHPSLVESFPQTFTEAMQFSKPLISIDLPYAREIAGDASLYFKDANGLVGVIEQYIKDESLLDYMSLQSKKRIKFFEPNVRWGELYEILKNAVTLR